MPVGRGDAPTSLATRFARAKERLEAPVTANFRDPAPLKQPVQIEIERWLSGGAGSKPPAKQ